MSPAPAEPCSSSARADGRLIARINPFGTSVDAATFVAGGLAADGAGSVFYNAVRLDLASPWTANALGAWLVKVAPDGTAARAAFSALVPGAPAASAAVPVELHEQPAVASLGERRAAQRILRIAASGHQRDSRDRLRRDRVHGQPRALQRRYGYLRRGQSGPHAAVERVAARNPFRRLRRAPAAERTPGGCRAGATPGVDPATNDMPAGRVSDLSSSSPVVLPDGSSPLRRARPATTTRAGTSSGSPARAALSRPTISAGTSRRRSTRTTGPIRSSLKDNHYELGSYCGDPQFCPPQARRYDLTSLDPNLSRRMEIHELEHALLPPEPRREPRLRFRPSRRFRVVRQRAGGGFAWASPSRRARTGSCTRSGGAASCSGRSFWTSRWERPTRR